MAICSVTTLSSTSMLRVWRVPDPAGIEAPVKSTPAMFSDFRNELDVIVGEDDIAVSYGRITGTTTAR